MFKRWRPTRAWLVEVANITLGVLIALGLGAVATEIGWRMEVAAARDALADDLGETVGQAFIRVRLAPCVERRLDAIAAILDQAEVTGRLPAVGNIGTPAWFTWNTGTWDSVRSAQTATHFSRDDQTGYGGAAEFTRALNESNRAELALWTRLYAIVGPGRAITTDELNRLRGAVSDARQANRFVGLASVRVAQQIYVYGLRFDHPTALYYRTTYLNGFLKGGVCEPLPAPAGERYGSAPWKNSLANALRNPLSRPR